MSGYVEFVNVFRSTLLDPPLGRAVADPVKVEVFRGPRTFRVPHLTARVAPAGRDLNLATVSDLELPPEETFISLTARTKKKDQSAAKRFCENHVDRVIAILSILTTPDLFAEQIYRGWIVSGDTILVDGWLRLSHPFSLSYKDISNTIAEIRRFQETTPNLNERIGLMSRFFAKAAATLPGEEKLVLLWTVLEIFPMQNANKIRPVVEFLSTLLKKPQQEVNETLGIGRMHGIRSDLVHHGRLTISQAEMGEFFTKLERICAEVLRAISGLPYGGSLNVYFP